MEITFSTELMEKYPSLLYGALRVEVPKNGKSNEKLEETKRKVEAYFREIYNPDDPVISIYQNHFKNWGTKYPILYQIDSIKKGRKFPNVSALVDAMFVSELKTRTLTSGHDIDEIQGNLNYDLAVPGDQYVNLSGKTRTLKENDVVLHDEHGILGSVLYGPTKRTTIGPNTTKALYLAWNPFGLSKDHVQGHIEDISANLSLVYPNLSPNYWTSS